MNTKFCYFKCSDETAKVMCALGRESGNGISFAPVKGKDGVYVANRNAYRYAVVHCMMLDRIDDVCCRIGQRIAELRRECGMSQEKMCRKWPGLLKLEYLQEIEGGWVNMTIQSLDKFAKFFGKQIDII